MASRCGPGGALGTPVDPDEPDDVDDAPRAGAGEIDAHVNAAMRLMLEARRQGFVFTHAQVGMVAVHGLKDLRPRFGTGPTADPDDNDPILSYATPHERAILKGAE